MGYQKLMVLLTKETSALPDSDGPLVSYVTYRAQEPKALPAWLLAQGFHKAYTQRRITSSNLCCKVAHEISFAQEDEVREFFKEYFPPIMADLPMEGMFGTLIAVRDNTGKPLGILHYDDTKMPRIVAVRPEARGQGIASSLFARLNEVKGDKELKGWVRDGNDSAYHLYVGLGFQLDGLCSDVYIYEPEGL
jgi:GNAT superfamily N-acetyltransferase